jgi:hypothetical protein
MWKTNKSVDGTVGQLQNCYFCQVHPSVFYYGRETRRLNCIRDLCISPLMSGVLVRPTIKVPVTNFLKLAYGTRQGPVAMAPLAPSKADDIAA